MQITAVRVFLVQGLVIVRVETDAGVTGYGECSAMNSGVIKSVVTDSLAPLLVGQNPLEIERLWERMYVSTYKLRGQAQSIGISGVDIALWDILGKTLDTPVYQLLGGRYRERVRMYASSVARGLDPARSAVKAREYIDSGFTAVKVKVGTRWGFDDLPDTAIATVEAMRDTIGPDVDLMVDANSAYSAHAAIRVGRRLEALDVFHFEEPTPFHDIDGMAQIADALDMPVAGGEQDHTRYRFRELLERGAADILQPDVIKAGGLSECKKIAAMADAFGKPVTPHNTNRTIGMAATLHFLASTPNARYSQECTILPDLRPNPVRDSVLREPICVVDGHIAPPEGPGLGVIVDDSVLEQHGAG